MIRRCNRCLEEVEDFERTTAIHSYVSNVRYVDGSHRSWAHSYPEFTQMVVPDTRCNPIIRLVDSYDSTM
jgi:hypothetical protein